MCAHYLYAWKNSLGKLLAGGNQFTATQTDSYTLDSGEVKTTTFSWLGIRR